LADPGLVFREGSSADLAATYALGKRAMHDTALKQGVIESGAIPPAEAEIRHDWRRERSLIEFAAAQPGGCYWICENESEPVAYARVVRFGEMEELTELMVVPDHQDQGIGRALLERCWPSAPTPELGRVVVAAGAPSDLSLYTQFGVMPITGHWHMRERTEDYVEARSEETRDAPAPAVHVLSPDRATEEWKRLEPPAIGHQRPRLHEFFGRDRTCLAGFDAASGDVIGLCWVSADGDIGPAVGAEPEDLVPVVLAALDRVAKMKEPGYLSVFTTTISWWLLRRLRALGFKVYWPSWVMCSVPLPGLDRYVPTRPPRLL
jgi:GNAT superfamily N-acetyltransferase